MNLELVEAQLALLEHHGVQIYLLQTVILLSTGVIHKTMIYGKVKVAQIILALLGIVYLPKQNGLLKEISATQQELITPC
jgi:hypothetical protein